MSFDIQQIPSQKGRIAIVTGANTGLGFETALALAKKEAKVILACRNIEKAKEAVQRIKHEFANADLDVIQIDLSSLNSVKAFVKNYLAKYNRLDLLINNAGVMMPPFSETEDGFELQFAANHLGHFLLTGLLLDVLKSTKNSRVVALSSLVHKIGKINFDDLQSKQKYSASEAYGQSKLACLMFGYEMQRRLEKAGLENPIAVAAHPGLSLTDLGRHFPKFIYKLLEITLGKIFAQPASQGAKPTLMAALDSNVMGGEFYGPQGFNEMKGKPGKAFSTELANDRAIAAKLWEVSEELVGFSYL